MHASDNLEIRAAGEADAAAIAGCLAEAFAPYRSAYKPAAFADTVADEAGVRRRLGEMHILMAVESGKVVGTVAGAVNGAEGHLRGMAVLPAWQGTGLAARLLKAIEEWLRSQRCTHVTLDTTLPLEPAMRFYEKSGYRRSEKIGDFYGMTLIGYSKRLTKA